MSESSGRPSMACILSKSSGRKDAKKFKCASFAVSFLGLPVHEVDS